MVGPGHTFAQLADVINQAFARMSRTCTSSSWPMGGASGSPTMLAPPLSCAF
jgi:hypothetical protein